MAGKKDEASKLKEGRRKAWRKEKREEGKDGRKEGRNGGSKQAREGRKEKIDEGKDGRKEGKKRETIRIKGGNNNVPVMKHVLPRGTFILRDGRQTVLT